VEMESRGICPDKVLLTSASKPPTIGVKNLAVRDHQIQGGGRGYRMGEISGSSARLTLHATRGGGENQGVAGITRKNREVGGQKGQLYTRIEVNSIKWLQVHGGGSPIRKVWEKG